MTDDERFWSHVEFIPFHACWEWVGTRYVKGYGTFGRRALRSTPPDAKGGGRG